MREFVNKLIANLHFFLILYTLWGAYGLYEEHVQEMEQLQSQSTSLEQEIQNDEKKVKEIQEFVKKRDEYKVRVEEAAKNIETVQKQLPSDINDSQIMTFFADEMTLLNLKDSSLNPEAEEASTYWISKEYKLKAKGTFLQFLIFLERLGSADRIYNIKGLKLVALEEKKRGRFQVLLGNISIQAFRYNPSFKVDRGAVEREATVSPP